MKSLLSAAVIFTSSLALMSCGGSADAEAEAEASVKSHAEIAEQVAGTMTDMMTEMAAIKDVASAEAFAGTIPAVKDKMKGLLKAAQALPAPTDEEKAAFESTMKAAEEKAGPAMMAMMMGLAQNPDAEAIGKVMESVMEDEEMETVVETLEGIYKVEDGAESGATIGE